MEQNNKSRFGWKTRLSFGETMDDDGDQVFKDEINELKEVSER